MDDFLSAAELDALSLDYHALYADGKFKLAGIGKNQVQQLNAQIRTDETLWMDENLLSVAQDHLFKKLELLKNEINEKLFLGLWNLEGHYSFYPMGGFYKKHLDRFASDDVRTISMVLYLNQNWNDSSGGELRIHHAELPDGVQNILPLGGRLVCFLSSQIEHEVLITQQNRFSFAGWWKRRAATI